MGRSLFCVSKYHLFYDFFQFCKLIISCLLLLLLTTAAAAAAVLSTRSLILYLLSAEAFHVLRLQCELSCIQGSVPSYLKFQFLPFDWISLGGGGQCIEFQDDLILASFPK